MAMVVPKSGYARLLKDGAQVFITIFKTYKLPFPHFFKLVGIVWVIFQHFKGTEEAVQRNIEACVQLSSQVQSAFGPSGIDLVQV